MIVADWALIAAGAVAVAANVRVDLRCRRLRRQLAGCVRRGLEEDLSRD